MPDQAKVSRPSGSGVGLAFPDDVQGFPYGSAGKESACNAGDPGSSPGSGRSAGEAIGYPLQYSGPGDHCWTAALCERHHAGSQHRRAPSEQPHHPKPGWASWQLGELRQLT